MSSDPVDVASLFGQIDSDEVNIGIYTSCVLRSVFTVSLFTQLEIGMQRPCKDIEEEEEGQSV